MKFERLYRLINENPDLCFDNRWRTSDFAFFYHGDSNSSLLCYTQSSSYPTHEESMKVIMDDIEKNPDFYYNKGVYTNFNGYRKEFINAKPNSGIRVYFDFELNGTVKWITDITNGKRYFPREMVIKAGVLVGRCWEHEKLVAFWNNVKSMKLKDFVNLEKIIPDMKNYIFDFSTKETFSRYDKDDMHISNYNGIDRHWWGSYDDIVNFLNNNNSSDNTTVDFNDNDETEDLDVVHLMDPAEKGDKMKGMGIKPKTPIPLKDKMRREGD